MKENLKKKKKKKRNTTSLNSFQFIVAFSGFRGYSNVALGWNGLKSTTANKNPYKNSKFRWYIWHNRQKHSSHFHVSIFVLKMFRDVAVLCFSGKFAQSNGVLYFTVSKPYFTIFFDSLDIIWSSEHYGCFYGTKRNPPWLGGAKPLIIFKSSTTNACKFLWCVVIWLFAWSRCSKVLVLSFVINLRDLSWILLIRLWAFREQNIQAKGQ